MIQEVPSLSSLVESFTGKGVVVLDENVKKNLSELLPERVYTAFIEYRFHESELHGDSKPTVTQMLTYMDRFTHRSHRQGKEVRCHHTRDGGPVAQV